AGAHACPQETGRCTKWCNRGWAGGVLETMPAETERARDLRRRETRKVTTSNGSSNGTARHQHEKVRVAIIGVGNCASSFVQGVQYYKDADPANSVPGLMHVDLGGYHVRDIEFSAA